MLTMHTPNQAQVRRWHEFRTNAGKVFRICTNPISDLHVHWEDPLNNASGITTAKASLVPDAMHKLESIGYVINEVSLA